MRHINEYLAFAMQNKASDIHFSADEPVRLRVHGDLVPLEEGPLSHPDLEALLNDILSPEERNKLQREKNLDKSYFVPQIGQFRVNIFFNRKGIAAVLRSIPVQVPSFEDLGLPDVIRRVAERPRGLILVTGPTGSGKSTTLAAIIDYLNTNFPYHILTVEDPVEFIHQSKASLVNQRDIGHSCNTFQDALKYALREDPDVILIGELRDLETISLALTAAETGHLVLGTLHTRGAAASIDRIIDSFPSGQQPMIRTMVAESLLAVVSQTLVKRADGKGRVAAYEIMVVNPAISNLIREGKIFMMEGVIQTGRKDGMILMEQSLMNLISQGIITREETGPYLKNGPSESSASNPPSSKAPTGNTVVTSLKRPNPVAPKNKEVTAPLPPSVPKPPPVAVTPPPVVPKPAPVAPVQSQPSPTPVSSPSILSLDESSENMTSSQILEFSNLDESDEILSSIEIEATNTKNIPKPPPAPPPLKKKVG